MTRPQEKETPAIQSASESFSLPQKHMFAVAEVAGFLGVNHKTVREQITAGKIRVVRLGKVIRIPRSEVLKLLGA